MISLETCWAIRCVWLRYFDVYRKNIYYGLVTTFVEPILYLLSFGYGMGALIGNIHTPSGEISYRQFIFAGIVAQSVLFQGFFEAAYGSFIRMYYQRIFKAIAMTPITLSEVLWGELLWDATKGTISASTVLLIGVGTGDFNWLGALLCVPICFLSAMLFGALGLWMAAISRNIEQLSYPQYLLVFPMFLFCGIYYPLDKLPIFLQYIAWVFPLTSVQSLIRTATLGFPYQPQAPFIILAWLPLLVWISRYKMTHRLVK